MSKVNTMEQDNIYVRYSIIIVGITIMSIGVNGFLRQAHLLSGGVAGIATAINYITNINVGFLTFIINVPIFLLGFIFLEKDLKYKRLLINQVQVLRSFKNQEDILRRAQIVYKLKKRKSSYNYIKLATVDFELLERNYDKWNKVFIK